MSVQLLKPTWPVESAENGRAGSKKMEEAFDTSSHASRYARVSRLATDQSDDKKKAEAKLNDIDPGLLSRIRKALKLAQHSNTPESEAQNALRNAGRLLSAANLTEADVMSHESEEEQLQRAGHSIVTVRHKEGKAVSLESWSGTLASAIEIAFNVKSFYTRFTSHTQIQFTFYGLCDNTIAAVVSFEAVFNLALAWAARRTDIKGRTGKNSYLVGLSDSLYRMAKKEKNEEETKAIETERRAIRNREQAEKEEEQRKADRLEPAALPSPAEVDKTTKVEDNDDDDDDDDDDDVVFVKVKPGRGTSLGEVRVKDEPIDLDDDDEDFGTSSRFGDGGRAGGATPTENVVDDEIGDLNTERRRFDATFATLSNGRPLQEFDSSLPAEASMMIKPDLDVKPKMEDGAGGTAEPSAAGSSVKDEADDDSNLASWQSHAQLVTFKATASRLADDYLESINTKLTFRNAKPKPVMRDNDAYHKGKEDGRKVDLKRRRLE